MTTFVVTAEDEWQREIERGERARAALVESLRAKEAALLADLAEVRKRLAIVRWGAATRPRVPRTERGATTSRLLALVGSRAETSIADAVEAGIASYTYAAIALRRMSERGEVRRVGVGRYALPVTP